MTITDDNIDEMASLAKDGLRWKPRLAEYIQTIEANERENNRLQDTVADIVETLRLMTEERNALRDRIAEVGVRTVAPLIEDRNALREANASLVKALTTIRDDIWGSSKWLKEVARAALAKVQP
jgi:uncharacterized membrane-anchored protein YjiN (DUF445 family)